MMFSLAMASATLPTASAVRTAPARWQNTTDGIHAFLTFDSFADPANLSRYAENISFVWGASASRLDAWRRSANPAVVLSHYIPFTRDPAPNRTAEMLPWWQANHPSLVLYTCDRATPAWECFSGEGCSHASVPLDLTLPATLEYQMRVGVLPARDAGYNAIALDNYGLSNVWKACGSFSGANGSWVQKYNASAPEADSAYAADVLDWTRRAVDAIHAAGMLVIPNFSSDDLNDDSVLAVANLTDGMLAEGGFASWNPVPNTSSYDTPPPKTTPTRFERQVAFVRYLQRRGKGYFAINQWGAGPDYGLNPGKQPHNVTPIDTHTNRPIRQFVAAAYMMVNGGACAVFLSCSGQRQSRSRAPSFSPALDSIKPHVKPSAAC
jgi:hypothetical protein